MPEVTNTKAPSDKQAVGQGDKKAALKTRTADDDPKDNDVDDEMMSLPDYLLPVRQTMSGNFHSLHEEHLVSQLMTKWNLIKDENQQTREQARRVVRKIAVEEITKDWMSSAIDAEVRSFMVDNILPTLVLGVEKLLVEVEKRNLVETTEPDNNFNPLNFLAQYLMRNNPKYSNYAEASPYMRGLRSISEELKLQLLSHADNRLMHVKIATRLKREDREAAESVTAGEAQRRIDALQLQFIEWGNGKKIELALVQNALLSFVEMVSQMSPEVRASVRLSKELEPTDDTGRGVHQTDFVEHLMPFVTSMSNSAFDMLLSHLSSCAKIYRYSLESSEHKAALLQLFKSCDYSKVGLLSRHRIMGLLAAFYNRHSAEVKSSLRDPGQWPVKELSELEDDETCGLEVSEDVQESKAGEKTVILDGENNEGKRSANTMSPSSVQDGPILSPQEELQIREFSFQMVEKVINDAREIVAAEEESLSPVSQEPLLAIATPPPFNATEEDDGLLVKAVSAGSRMIDRGVAFVDHVRLDNWTGTLAYSSLSQSQLCVFNEYTLNGAQFVQLIDTFLNMSVDSALFNQLLSYIKEGYVMAEDEQTLNIMKERLTTEQLQRKAKLNRLFDIWDNEGSGFLNCDEVTWIIGTYKDLREREVADKALVAFREKFDFTEDRFTKHEFRDFLMCIVELLPRGDTFDMFVDFLIGSIALSYAEQARGDARKKWLQQMIVAAETSGSNMEPVYKSLFDAIIKDAELHGDDKSVSISIALLERNLLEPERGVYLLRNTAATPDHSKHVVGKVYYKDMKGISFAAVASGRPIHVPKISRHGNIHFWDPEKNSENSEGSFIAIPLKDKKKRVFGLLCIDTMNDSRNQKTLEPVSESVQVEKEEEEEEEEQEDLDAEDAAVRQLRKSSISCIFSGHEIQFFQGVAKAFSIAYHLVNVRQKMVQTSEHALSWNAHRCPHIQESTLYLVESTRETMDIVLRKMMVTKSGGSVSVFNLDPPQLERKDNFFREYLFKCADSSELVAMTAYSELHLVIPLRNNDGQTVIVYDVNFGNLKTLPKSEMYEMTRTLQLLQEAYKEITLESQDGVRTTVLKGDQMDNDTRTEVLFGRLMLLRLRQSISRLDGSAYKQLRHDGQSTEVCHPIVKAALCLLQPDLVEKGIAEDWQKCLIYVGPNTGAKIVLYDPTEHSTTDTPVALIISWLKDIPYEKIAKHRSLLVRHLYDWVWTSLLLIKSVSNAKGHQLNGGASK